jgi:hypothetical protein
VEESREIMEMLTLSFQVKQVKRITNELKPSAELEHKRHAGTISVSEGHGEIN